MTHPDLFNRALMLVGPLRQEFGCKVDVGSLLRDKDYAKSILDMARDSKNDRLREQALYIESKIFGPRASAPPQVSPVADAAPPADDTMEQSARMKKYQGGLR